MSEALARVRNDSILVRPAKPTGTFRRIVRCLAEGAGLLPLRVYVGSAFSALLVGIGVNALLLQRERHPAPLVRPVVRHDSQAFSNASPLRPAPADSGRVAPTPAFALPKSPSDEAGPRPPDQIGDLLRGAPRGDRMILAAQSALARLGYSVKPDGVEGAATEQALRDFERSHGLPVTTDVTPRLVKELAGAARAAR